MDNKETIRKNLLSIPCLDKIPIWNKFCSVHYLNKYIFLNKPSNLEDLAMMLNERIANVAYSDRFNKDDEFIAILDDGYIHTFNSKDAHIFVDAYLYTDFADAVYDGDKFASNYYNDKFPPTDVMHTDSDESNGDTIHFDAVKQVSYYGSNGESIRCKLYLIDGEPNLDTVVVNKDETKRFHFVGNEAVEALKKIENKYVNADVFNTVTTVFDDFDKLLF